MTIVDDMRPQSKGPGMIVQAAMLAGATLVAVGIGIGAGFLLDDGAPASEEAVAEENVRQGQSLRDLNQHAGVVYLDPITTNMAGGNDMWVRLEMGLVFDGQPDAEIAREVQQDTLAFLRTIKSHQVEGASGYRHFRADLEERAAMRSDGKVTGILIRTLLFE